MGVVKKGLVVIFGVFLVLTVIGIFLPENYGLSRSVQISAEPQVVMDQVMDLQNYSRWMPWRSDPTMKVTLADKVRGEGASMSWVSEDSGSGTLTIAVVKPSTMLATRLVFEGRGQGGAIWTFAGNEEGTLVTWTMNAEANGQLERWAGLFIERMAGPDFERGLQNLKRQAESATTAR